MWRTRIYKKKLKKSKHYFWTVRILQTMTLKQYIYHQLEHILILSFIVNLLN